MTNNKKTLVRLRGGGGGRGRQWRQQQRRIRFCLLMLCILWIGLYFAFLFHLLINNIRNQNQNTNNMTTTTTTTPTKMMAMEIGMGTGMNNKSSTYDGSRENNGNNNEKGDKHNMDKNNNNENNNNDNKARQQPIIKEGGKEPRTKTTVEIFDVVRKSNTTRSIPQQQSTTAAATAEVEVEVDNDENKKEHETNNPSGNVTDGEYEDVDEDEEVEDLDCYPDFEYSTEITDPEVEFMIGPCVVNYPHRSEPTAGWVEEIDYYLFRNTSAVKIMDQIHCLHHCIDQYVVGVGQQEATIVPVPPIIVSTGGDNEIERGNGNSNNNRQSKAQNHNNNNNNNRNKHNHVVGVITIEPVLRVPLPVEEDGSEGSSNHNNKSNNNSIKLVEASVVQRAMIQEEGQGRGESKNESEVSTITKNDNDDGENVTLVSEEVEVDDTVEVDHIMLIEAAQAGMIELTRVLMKEPYNCNPLYRHIPEVGGERSFRSFNAIQEAIRGGYTDIVHILSKGNTHLIIDRYNRTIEDYVCLQGSPIRPPDALRILGIDVMKILKTNTQKKKNKKIQSRQQKQTQLRGRTKNETETRSQSPSPESSSGWSTQTNRSYDDTICDIDVIEDGELSAEVFFRDYFVTGRPLVLRNYTSPQELLNFQKSNFMKKKGTSKSWKTKKIAVGPTAYPSLTDQHNCQHTYTIEELEAGLVCEEMPEIPMVFAYHPKDDDFKDIWPDYNGDPMSSSYFRKSSSSSSSSSNDTTTTNNTTNNTTTFSIDSNTSATAVNTGASFQIIKQWFGHVVQDRSDLAWQVFFGGDGSGATYHWHNAAFNTLYVGIKEWKIAPPLYRGFSGMPTLLVSQALETNTVNMNLLQYHYASTSTNASSSHSTSTSSQKNTVPSPPPSTTPSITHIPTLRCIQKPGDLFYIPNSWGHMTINHGFTIGAAALLDDYYQMDGAESLRIGKE